MMADQNVSTFQNWPSNMRFTMKSRRVYVEEMPYFLACKMYWPIRCILIFSLGILEKMMMNVFQF
jgi:hypothetical protein